MHAEAPFKHLLHGPHWKRVRIDLKPCRSHALRLLAEDEDRSFEDGVLCCYTSLRRWAGGAQRARERLGAGDALEAQPHVREEAGTRL